MNKNLHIINREDIKCLYVVEQNKIIIPVNDYTFDIVCKVINNHTCLNTEDEIAIYKEIEPFLDEKTEDISTFDYFETDYSKTNKMTIMLTQKCNLACKYCYGGDSGKFSSNGEKMSFKIAKKAINYLMEKSKECENYSICFFGGEPLLNFDVLKKTVDYCNTLVKIKNKKFSYSITTNGTLFDDEIIYFLKDNNILVTISLDGNESQHDKYRYFPDGKGSHKIILNNIEKIRRIGLHFSIRATIPMEFFDKYDEINSFLNSLGADNVIMSRVSIYDNINKDKLGIEDSDNNELFVKFHEVYSQMHDIDNIYDRKTELMPSILYASKKRIFCGFMKGTTTVSTSGILYPCHRFVGMSGFSFGNIEDGINKVMMKFILDELDNSTKDCISCFARYTCQRNCIRDIALDGGKFQKIKKGFCDEMKKQIEDGIILAYRMLS